MQYEIHVEAFRFLYGYMRSSGARDISSNYYYYYLVHYCDSWPAAAVAAADVNLVQGEIIRFSNRGRLANH